MRKRDLFSHMLLIEEPSRNDGNIRSAMRILLQQIETGLYFKGVGDWTRSPADGRDFISSSNAIDFCAANKITGVQMVLKFEEQLYDIVLPLVARRHYRAERSLVTP